jgi:hypothetical protein
LISTGAEAAPPLSLPAGAAAGAATQAASAATDAVSPATLRNSRRDNALAMVLSFEVLI